MAKPISATKIAALAKRLRTAIETGNGCKPLRNDLPAVDLDAAYAVQETNTKHWLKAGRRPVGRKIGLTSKVVQVQLGVDQPDFGMLFADMAVPDGEEIAAASVMQPKIEGEVAFVLDRDLAVENPTIADVTNAIGYATAAIEVVGSRIANWDINIVDTIADNASSGLFVLGNECHSLADFNSRLCGMVVEHRGEPVSVGAGAACLGNPLNAVIWLAREMVERGRPLAAGDIIMSGALGPMVPVASGEVYEVRISGLGSVRAAFA
ncbi:MAG: fumarylacetoacetate hydrolase family protein [Alphaproteobacteria bacterium]|nr:fumarylacetoacetate hydrolase family protein [Alphaproteobacteria bacterium]